MKLSWKRCPELIALGGTISLILTVLKANKHMAGLPSASGQLQPLQEEALDRCLAATMRGSLSFF